MPAAERAMVIGSGGREHALVWKLQQELGAENVLFVPGNAGVPDSLRRNADIKDIEHLYHLAHAEKADLVVVGPEDPLVIGITDYFSGRGMPTFGPSQRAARLEGSKAYAKRFMAAHDIPTAEFVVTDSAGDAYRYGKQFIEAGGAAVIKLDGLAAGKGVSVCKSEEQLASELARLQRLNASDRIVVEKFLKGEEVSYIAFADGEHILPLLATQDHKAAYDNDEGPNTGGMGAYTRPMVMTPQLERKIIKEIMLKTMEGMAEDGRPYKSVLYAGLMIVNGQPYVLEYNCRFGDPETQPVMALMDSPLHEILYATMEGRLDKSRITWKPGEAMTVVLATKGYPDEEVYRNNLGNVIHGLDRSYDGVVVFHSGTRKEGDSIVNSGGRVLSITGCGYTHAAAQETTYSAIGEHAIHLEGMHNRGDVGRRSLITN